MNNQHLSSTTTKITVGPVVGAGFGFLIIVCCATPALIAGAVAAGGLAAVGAWFSDPCGIAGGAALATLVVVQVARRITWPTGVLHRG